MAATRAAAFLAVGLFAASPDAAQNGTLPASTGTANFMPAFGFSDISAEHTYYAPITWMATDHIAQGYADGTFKELPMAMWATTRRRMGISYRNDVSHALAMAAWSGF